MRSWSSRCSPDPHDCQVNFARAAPCPDPHRQFTPQTPRSTQERGRNFYKMPRNAASSSSNSARARLSQISSQVSPSPSPDATMSAFGPDVVPQAPEDPLFGLMAAYRADSSDRKVDLGIGAYRDDNAKPWVLPVVKKAGRARPRACPRQPVLTVPRPMTCCAPTRT